MKFTINVVLVRTMHSSNVGATARVMGNMGASRLILVDPQCDIDMQARFSAASSQKYLNNRTWYGNWQQFYENEPPGLRIAFTPKDGKGRAVRWANETFEQLKDHSIFEEIRPTPVYLIFGAEDHGLDTIDLEFTHHNCALPTYGDNQSLNLAQAVLLGLFIARQAWGGKVIEIENFKDRTIKNPEYFPDKTLKDWITVLGFDLGNRKINAYSVLKRMMLSQTPTPQEINVFEAVVQQTIRKLKEKN
ncbi:MAG: TrmH family RNA methyltransferase [Pseudobdellovibrionaceae bacterium]